MSDKTTHTPGPWDIETANHERGWQCPKCGSIYAQFVMECGKCNSRRATFGKVKNQPPDLTAGEFNRGE